MTQALWFCSSHATTQHCLQVASGKDNQNSRFSCLKSTASSSKIAREGSVKGSRAGFGAVNGSQCWGTTLALKKNNLKSERVGHGDRGLSVQMMAENCDRNGKDAQVALLDDLEEASVYRFTNDLPEWGGNKEIPISPIMDIDFVTEGELKENAFRSARRTKLVCTIGPSCSSSEQLEALAIGGMNVARINMCHGTKEWHRSVIRRIKTLNQEKGYSVTLMMDTEGSEIHMGDLGGAQSSKAEDGDEWVCTVRKFHGPLPQRTIQVNYDGFAEDVMVGDELVVDGGMVRFEVVEKMGPDIYCQCTDPGLLLPRANLTIWRNGHLLQERNAMLPTISSKDWLDIDFGLAEGVDFIAVSFVQTADVIKHLKSYIAARSPNSSTGVFAKIESAESLKNLEEILQVSDGVMVARGDLGAQIPLEQVPSVQHKVADVSEAVRQRADALMLSGESAMGLFPEKALSVLRTVSLRIELRLREEKYYESLQLPTLSTILSERISEEICASAAQMANKLGADAIFVYTRRGYMASLLSRNRPDCPIFAFTHSASVRRRLNLHWGVIPFRLDFADEMESNLCQTFSLLKARGMIRSGELIIAVSDITPENQTDILQSIQVRKIP
ncbi:hypothetical protein O6H91_04G006100 [Diphasiastrum complanatum]|uniref:Uncharacterized protein n=1 Tax=Diphasiastrum complanatum TaxID=34168 RepID=A0ACC2DTW5_DIPCM|nr:hypothetical protein O6H91_04G006100 [Diphasiastrum complanatum]